MKKEIKRKPNQRQKELKRKQAKTKARKNKTYLPPLKTKKVAA